MGLNWYVIRTQSGQEFRASSELLNQGFQTYIPTIKSKPLFSRYIFIEFDRDIDPWGKIRSTRGCVDVLRSGILPQPVPQKAMEAIMAFEDIPEPNDEPIFVIGQPVVITTGILRGYSGLFTGTAKNRTEALLEVMGNKLFISLKDIEPAA